MSSLTLKQFQDQVSELLLRHRSILDVMSKSQQTNAAIHRAVVKAVTECGCIQLQAGKQEYSEDLTLQEAKEFIKTHVQGSLCEHCKDAVTLEIGRNLFYLSSLCNTLELDLEQIMTEESKRCSALGLFNLS